MGFGTNRHKIRTRGGRGSADADAVLAALGDSWDEFSGTLAGLTDANKLALAALVDPIAEDSDPTPFEMLTGNLDTFQAGIM